MDTLDFRRGQSRRIYSSAKYGRRINAVSDFAARLLAWGLIPNADDFGNIAGDPAVLKCECFPMLPSATPERISEALAELESNRLVGSYQLGPDRYIHVHGHNVLQPAPKNGRKIRRWPPSPWDNESELSSDSGESGGIRGNPGESGGIQDPPIPDLKPIENGGNLDDWGIRGNPGESGGDGPKVVPVISSSSSSVISKVISSSSAKAPAAAAEFSEEGGLISLRGCAELSIDPDQVLRLNELHTRGQVAAAIAALAHRVRGGERLRNPLGMLRKMLAEGYSPPVGKAAPIRKTETAEEYELRKAPIRAAEAAKLAAAVHEPFSDLMPKHLRRSK